MVVRKIEIYHLDSIVLEDTDPICFSMSFHYGKTPRRNMGEAKIKEIEFVLWLTGGWYCQPYKCAINQEKNKRITI